jgi:hypothetical protein
MRLRRIRFQVKSRFCNSYPTDELVLDWESQAECARLMQDLTNVNEEIRAHRFFAAILRFSKDALSETVKDGVAEREGAGG